MSVSGANNQGDHKYLAVSQRLERCSCLGEEGAPSVLVSQIVDR